MEEAQTVEIVFRLDNMGCKGQVNRYFVVVVLLSSVIIQQIHAFIPCDGSVRWQDCGKKQAKKVSLSLLLFFKIRTKITGRCNRHTDRGHGSFS